MLTDRFAKLKWWQIALVSIAVSAIGGLASMQSHKKNIGEYEDKLKQAPWAPPGWLFAPAWNFNNFFLLMGLQRLLKSDLPDKKRLLVLQAMIWVVFFSFGYVYFKKNSPLLAAAWTMSDAALAATSFTIALKSDKKLAFNYLPLLAWTGFASSVADYQALKNPDPIFNTKAWLN
jgi:tryptophan-rich sensory protein